MPSCLFFFSLQRNQTETIYLERKNFFKPSIFSWVFASFQNRYLRAPNLNYSCLSWYVLFELVHTLKIRIFVQYVLFEKHSVFGNSFSQILNVWNLNSSRGYMVPWPESIRRAFSSFITQLISRLQHCYSEALEQPGKHWQNNPFVFSQCHPSTKLNLHSSTLKLWAAHDTDTSLAIVSFFVHGNLSVTDSNKALTSQRVLYSSCNDFLTVWIVFSCNMSWPNLWVSHQVNEIHLDPLQLVFQICSQTLTYL